MILVDTSVWVDHLRRGDRELSGLLGDLRVLTHPFIIGELATGNLAERPILLQHLRNLPAAKVATDGEVHRLVEERNLMGRGIGWVDAHLLASALISASARILTRDKRLAEIARELQISA
jgi:predicted nucleic acid-binding protein